MNQTSSIACVLAIGLLTVGHAGCSAKNVHSSGTTSQMPRGGGQDPNRGGLERVRPGIVLTKADPSATRRQMDEIRAEQAQTAAAGLEDVFFTYDSWTVSEEGRAALTKDAEWLRSHGMPVVRVEGHCDERGSSAYNLVLAEKRAKAVRNYLVQLGLRSDRLAVVSYGKERPFCTEHAESCHQQNRRSHLVIKP